LPAVVNAHWTDPFASGITAGPDGAIWYTQGQSIVRLSLDGRTKSYFTQNATEIAAGADGTLWFTSGYLHLRDSHDPPDAIGSIGLEGEIKLFPLPRADAAPARITRGPQNSMWFTEAVADRIGRIDSRGRIYEIQLPLGRHPQGIAADSRGDIWFTESWRDTIGRLSVHGKLTEFPISGNNSVYHDTLGLVDIAIGPDGRVWFTEFHANRIGRLDMSGKVSQYQLGDPKSGPDDIISGPDGNLWFVEVGASKIGRITPTGQLTEFLTPRANSAPRRITVGPDKNLWFTQGSAFHFLGSIWGAIGKVILH
jgi:virginiamycin B lyase